MPLVTVEHLADRGWTRREESVWRFDLPQRPLYWLELIEVPHGWRPVHVRYGLREMHAVIVTTDDLYRFVSAVLAGKL